MHQAADLVTTVKMATSELRIQAASLDIVAEGGIALRALLAWCFLCAKLPAGRFSADLKGMDLNDPAVWAQHAYFPCLLRNGGIKAIARLAAGKRAVLSGVPRSCHTLFPRSFSLSERSEPLSASFGRVHP